MADEEGDGQTQWQQQQRWNTLALQENNRLRQCVDLGREQLAQAGPVSEAEAKLAAVGIGGMLRRLSAAVASGATAAGGMLAKLIDCISAIALAGHRWALTAAAGASAFFTAYQYDGHPVIKNMAAFIACQGSGWAALRVIRANVLLPSETTTRTHMQHALFGVQVSHPCTFKGSYSSASTGACSNCWHPVPSLCHPVHQRHRPEGR